MNGDREIRWSGSIAARITCIACDCGDAQREDGSGGRRTSGCPGTINIIGSGWRCICDNGTCRAGCFGCQIRMRSDHGRDRILNRDGETPIGCVSTRIRCRTIHGCGANRECAVRCGGAGHGAIPADKVGRCGGVSDNPACGTGGIYNDVGWKI